jgi:dTDP-4-dehydrorhamnose 3,5-epimerase-like enzyme
VGNSSEVVELSRENVIVVFVPVGASHSLEALSDLSYLVLKDGLD